MGWLAAIAGLAALHALHLRADFPNGSPWQSDWAKYTDEGWWANAAVRAHLSRHWFQEGDFNPAVALPAWPALEWVVFAAAGVTVEAARGLAVMLFFANLALSYLLVRARGPRWAGLLAVTLMAASPFLYCFSRLAILEPLLIALTLGALNLAVRAGRWRRPALGAAGAGLLFALAMLTKTMAVFLAPAIAWAMWMALRRASKPVWKCGASALAAAAGAYGAWLALIAHFGLMADYRYLFFINDYPKPKGFLWPAVSFYWSLHGALWIDRVLIPLAGAASAAAVAAAWLGHRSDGTRWQERGLPADPAFGACLWAVAGSILFMTYQDHPQPRYFTLVAYFAFILVALGVAALLQEAEDRGTGRGWARRLGWACAAVAVAAAGTDAAQTIAYAEHPQYTLVNAAAALTHYIDTHPNGRRLLVATSGDEIMLVTHLPALCDDFGTLPLPDKLARYQPGWFAAWNDLDPGTLEDLHTHYSLEQVASFPALDDPERNVLVLFKLHPLPGGETRTPGGREDLRQPLAGDKIDVMVE